MAESRQAVLSLYSRILRTARTWEGPLEEKLYIVTETRQQFRANKDIPAEEVAGKVRRSF
jgi:hypothetical protein